jgi:hypothetical protein
MKIEIRITRKYNLKVNESKNIKKNEKYFSFIAVSFFRKRN